MVVFSHSSVAISCVVLVLSFYAWKILNWVWLRPKKLEKYLRQQGFKGNSYRFLFGDLKELTVLMKEAKSKPINFSHDIVPRVVPSFHKTVTTHGNSCFMWFGPRPAVLMFDHEIIREILAKSYVFQKPASRVTDLLIRGLATYETDKWAKHRRLILPSFHPDKLKQMLPSFYQSCNDMLNNWEKKISSEGSCELDVWPYLQTLTSDAISRTAFGSSYEEGRKIFDLQKEQAGLITQRNMSFYIPFWRFLPTKSNRRIKNIQKQLDTLVMGVINERIKSMKLGKASNDDLLGVLLESNSKEIQQNGDKFGMSLQEVVEECKLFYFAGQETTSSLLVWTMILLSKHLDWQTRAREEVIQAFGKGKPDFQGLNNLKVLTMIFQEVLRLYPSAVMLTRMTGKGSTFGSLTLPAGVQLLFPIILLQHDPKIWGNDVNEFNPERFSEGVTKATKGQLSYFPFGSGPRICIGQNFAMLEAKMALSMILQHYSLELSPTYSHAPHTVIALQPQHGAHLILHKL